MSGPIVVKPLEKIALDAITAKPPRAMGKARLVFLEPMMLVNTPKLTQAWPIRPTDEKNEKFSLEVRLESGEQDAFRAALTNFDMRVRRLAFENKKTWFGKAADDIQAESDLRQMHTMSIKKGNEKADGSRYDDSIKFTIKGWSDHVDEVLYKDAGDKQWPVDCKWKTRLVDANGRGGPSDSDTKFYICENRDMTTGKEQMAPWTPCQDPAGNQIRDANGNIKWEFVGPKHCQPGCKVTVVFQPTMVWLAAKFGVSLVAKQVFITPAPPKGKSAIEGIEIVDFVDPILASRAAKQAMGHDDLRDLEAVPHAVADEDDDHVETANEWNTGPAAAGAGPAVAIAESSSSSSSKKRSNPDAATSPAAKPAKSTTKKSKTIAVDEDF